MSSSSSAYYACLTVLFLLASPILASHDTLTKPDQNRVCLTFKYTVYVIDGMSSNNLPLRIHCKSNDDDLGNHTLWIGQDFHFHFGPSFFKTTHFVCDMNWGPKNQHVDVYTETVEGPACCGTKSCYWRAQDDGIYFGVDGTTWNKRLSWNVSSIIVVEK